MQFQFFFGGGKGSFPPKNALSLNLKVTQLNLSLMVPNDLNGELVISSSALVVKMLRRLSD